MAPALAVGRFSLPQALLSDNGSEFEADFAKTLDDHGIARWRAYHKTPKMNAHIEGLNRTLQESFVDHNARKVIFLLQLFRERECPFGGRRLV